MRKIVVAESEGGVWTASFLGANISVKDAARARRAIDLGLRERHLKSKIRRAQVAHEAAAAKGAE